MPLFLSLMLSMSAWTSAQGQTAITMDALTDRPAQFGADPVRIVSQWLVHGHAKRTHRFGRESFRIRLGRSFTLTVLKN